MCPLGACHGDHRPGAPSPVWGFAVGDFSLAQEPSGVPGRVVQWDGPRTGSTEAVQSGGLSLGEVQPVGPGGREAGLAWPRPACDPGVPVTRPSPGFCVAKGVSSTTAQTS